MGNLRIDNGEGLDWRMYVCVNVCASLKGRCKRVQGCHGQRFFSPLLLLKLVTIGSLDRNAVSLANKLRTLMGPAPGRK